MKKIIWVAIAVFLFVAHSLYAEKATDQLLEISGKASSSGSGEMIDALSNLANSRPIVFSVFTTTTTNNKTIKIEYIFGTTTKQKVQDGIDYWVSVIKKDGGTILSRFDLNEWHGSFPLTVIEYSGDYIYGDVPLWTYELSINKLEKIKDNFKIILTDGMRFQYKINYSKCPTDMKEALDKGYRIRIMDILGDIVAETEKKFLHTPNMYFINSCKDGNINHITYFGPQFSYSEGTFKTQEEVIKAIETR